jgi:hypothetical protein
MAPLVEPFPENYIRITRRLLVEGGVLLDRLVLCGINMLFSCWKCKWRVYECSK